MENNDSDPRLELTGEPCIRTFTGRLLNVADPSLDDICIEDIAHALSNICRFTGQCRKFLSVAEHSIAVSDTLYRWQKAQAPSILLAGLLHDASEAYLCDLARPVKRFTELGHFYEMLERRLMRGVARKFGLPEGFEEVPLIKDADVAVYYEEKLWNMWPHSVEPVGINFNYFAPAQVEKLFLTRFEALEESRRLIRTPNHDRTEPDPQG